MNILIAYASRHGTTQGIADRLGATLGRRGFEVMVRPVDQAGDIHGYDAIVIGSAAYALHWLKEAAEFVRHNRSLLATRPVWLFSSGPLGTDTTDARDHDVRAEAEPREFAEFRDAVQPRDCRVFSGAYDPDRKPIGLLERFIGLMPAARVGLPAGDFRNWAEIEAWAGTIANALTLTPASTR